MLPRCYSDTGVIYMEHIKRLFEGNLNIQHRCGTEAELREVEGYMEKHKTALENALTGDAKETFAKHCSCVEEALFLYGRECFVQGFSTGTRLAAEALLNAE